MLVQTRALRQSALVVTLLGALALFGCGAKSAQALLDDGKASVAKKDYRAAIVQLKGALEKEPKSLEARQLLGESLLASGDYAGAAVELGKAVEQGGDANRLTPLLADALLRSGDFKRLTQLLGSTKLADKNAQAALLVTLSSAWTGLSDPAKANALLDEAAALAPDAEPVVLSRARQAVGQSKFQDALAQIDKLLAAKPDSAVGWNFKGDILAAGLRDSANAEKAYKKALELDKTLLGAHFSLVNMYLRAGNLAAAKAQAESMRAALPKHPLATYVDAQIAFNTGNYDKAREISQELMRVSPNNIGVLLLAGTVAMQSRDMVQAETHLTKALQLDPSVDSAKIGLAHVYLDLGQPARTLSVLQPILAGVTQQSEALMLAGNAQLALGDAAAAEALFSRAAKASPDDTQVRTSLALTHLARGATDSAFAELGSVASASTNIIAEQAAYSARLQRREYDAALGLVDQIAKKLPDSPLQYELRGRVYLAQRDFAKARTAFEAQSKADPKNFGPTSNLAALDLLDRKPEAARERLRAAIKADPKNPYPLMALAELQTATEAPLDEVKQLLSKAIEVAPQMPEPRLQLIALTLRKRLYKESLVAAQEALAAMPGDQKVMDAVGRAQMEAGDVEQATKTFRKMVGASATSGLAYTRLADIYKATGRRDLAEGSLRKALEIEPGLAAAQAGLVDLMIGDKRGAEALAFIKKLQQDTPKWPAGYELEAQYQLRNKNVEGALTAYREGLAKTGAPALALGLHRQLLRNDRNAEAERFAASWLQSHPNDTDLPYQAAEAAIGRGKLPEAEAILRKLAVLTPDNVQVLNNLAYVIIEQGKSGSLPIIEKAAALAPNYWPVLDTLAAAQAADKQFDKALQTLKRAIELSPKTETLRLHLARTALQSGDKNLAKTELTRLKELGPQFKQQDEVGRLLKSL